MTNNPIELFRVWLREAEKQEPNNPNAVALATANKDGQPSVRMVLLKAIDNNGFVFFTNLKSKKGDELIKNPRASLCFHWKSLARQVRVEGTVALVNEKEADEYFITRSRLSRIGAWASKQSGTMKEKFELEKRLAFYTAKFKLGKVPRPHFWSGFCLKPRQIEFWSDKEYRLHERKVFYADGEDWKVKYLFP